MPPELVGGWNRVIVGILSRAASAGPDLYRGLVAARNLIGLVTLTYVPNYCNILPMYLAIPRMMARAVSGGRT